MKEAKIFSGRAHPGLTKEIVDKLDTELGKIELADFSDSEIHVQINESVRGKDIYIVQPVCNPVNKNLMELLIIIDAARRASAQNINAIVPYFGYSRQTKKSTGREPISAKLVANLLATAGAGRIVSVDLHKPQLQAYFDKPFDHLSAVATISNHIKSKPIVNPVIVAPVVGKAKLAEKYAGFLGYPLAIIHKKASLIADSRFGGLIGEVKGMTPIIVDDIMAEGSAIDQALTLLEYGCRPEIHFAFTHPILLHSAMDKLQHDAIKEVITTNTIPVDDKQARLPKLTILSIADLLSDVIYRIHHHMSVSKVFQQQSLDFPV
jgi:ribose-phosphate pyrophosphokinase